MSNEPEFSTPERILIVVARGAGTCRGRAVRFSDEAEIRFATAQELVAWIEQGSSARPATEDDETPRET